MESETGESIDIADVSVALLVIITDTFLGRNALLIERTVCYDETNQSVKSVQ